MLPLLHSLLAAIFSCVIVVTVVQHDAMVFIVNRPLALGSTPRLYLPTVQRPAFLDPGPGVNIVPIFNTDIPPMTINLSNVVTPTSRQVYGPPKPTFLVTEGDFTKDLVVWIPPSEDRNNVWAFFISLTTDLASHFCPWSLDEAIPERPLTDLVLYEPPVNVGRDIWTDFVLGVIKPASWAMGVQHGCEAWLHAVTVFSKLAPDASTTLRHHAHSLSLVSPFTDLVATSRPVARTAAVPRDTLKLVISLIVTLVLGCLVHVVIWKSAGHASRIWKSGEPLRCFQSPKPSDTSINEHLLWTIGYASTATPFEPTSRATSDDNNLSDLLSSVDILDYDDVLKREDLFYIRARGDASMIEELLDIRDYDNVINLEDLFHVRDYDEVINLQELFDIRDYDNVINLDELFDIRDYDNVINLEDFFHIRDYDDIVDLEGLFRLPSLVARGAIACEGPSSSCASPSGGPADAPTALNATSDDIVSTGEFFQLAPSRATSVSGYTSLAHDQRNAHRRSITDTAGHLPLEAPPPNAGVNHDPVKARVAVAMAEAHVLLEQRAAVLGPDIGLARELDPIQQVIQAQENGNGQSRTACRRRRKRERKALELAQQQYRNMVRSSRNS